MSGVVFRVNNAVSLERPDLYAEIIQLSIPNPESISLSIEPESISISIPEPEQIEVCIS